MNRLRSIGFALVLLCISALALFPMKPSKLRIANAADQGAFLGFDRNIYPGDAALPVLRKTFAFTSYWLSPPPGENLNTYKG